MLDKLKVQLPAIWLIPYVQLKAEARLLWAARFAQESSAVMPQIMTVREWAASSGAIPKSAGDVHFDAALDRVVATALLRRAGLETLPAYVDRLLDAVYELAGLAAAIHPDERLKWSATHAGLFQASLFERESGIGRVALIWAATSHYDSDILWHQKSALLESAQHIYITEGLQTDLLARAILTDVSLKVTPIVMDDSNLSTQTQTVSINELVATDAEDLVQQAAACVLSSTHNHLALVALDRQITRRISALLQNRGVTIIDETGWALSTTTASAQLLAWLHAMTMDATADQMLAALKTAPSAFNGVFNGSEVQKLEAKIRRESWVQWRQVKVDWVGNTLIKESREQFSKSRALVDWLKTTRDLLQSVGLWDEFQTDAAGQTLVKALHLSDPSVLSAMQNTTAPLMRLLDFIEWVRAVLEASRFSAKNTNIGVQESTKRVTILPLSQLWGRHFASVIVPGCDGRRLPARPHSSGDWTPAQRLALQLETPEQAQAAYVKAWSWLCGQCAQISVTLLWHQLEGNELLQKSSFLQILEMKETLTTGVDHRLEMESTPINGAIHSVFDQGVVMDWQQLAPSNLSASSYADLCACPYRFYAKRILGLQDADELDETVDKRDFGTWLHGVLYRFHEALKVDESRAPLALMDACALEQQAAMELDDAAFLPFSLIWPETRDAYLAWLAKHESLGARYDSGEVKKSIPLMVSDKTVQLIGTIDRMDTDPAGGIWLLDYKTESADKTRKRIAQSEDDTQLAFYAALMQGETQEGLSVARPLKAAFVNLAERKTAATDTKMHALADAKSSAETLIETIKDDLTQIAKGHGLRALGEGEACEYCAARGLCRKDFL